MNKSLLPPNSTELERNLEAIAARIDELTVPTDELWDPWRCPAELLPWLAWSLSIDEWSSDWPVQIQRQVIAESVPVHRLKGTVGAVRRAIGSLNASIDLIEWWQNGGTPHTASLVAYAQDNLTSEGDTLLTPELQEQLWRVVERTKPARSHIDFSVGVSMENQLGLAASANTMAYGRQTHQCQVPDQQLDGSVAVNGAASNLTLERREGLVSALADIDGHAYVSMAGTPALAVNRINMGVS